MQRNLWLQHLIKITLQPFVVVIVVFHFPPAHFEPYLYLQSQTANHSITTCTT